MAEYIEKDKAVGIAHGYCHTKDGRCCGPDDVVELYEELQAIPAADVVAVRHSHWVYDGYGEFHCHACKTIWHITEGTIDDLAFCPNCGAKMDGGADDGKAD